MSGFVKIQKHSDRSALQVIEGSKVITPLFCHACSLFVFRVLVSESLSRWVSGAMGFSFGAMRSILIWASSAHAFGFRQPLRLSRTQSLHMHCGPRRCVGFWVGSHIRADVWTSSATFVIAWLFNRHLDTTLVIGRRSAAMWYHVGSCFFSWLDSFMAARFVSCFLATAAILIISLLRPSVRLPLVGMFQDCRNGFSRALLHMFVGADVSIIRSTTAAHVGRVGERFR